MLHQYCRILACYLSKIIGVLKLVWELTIWLWFCHVISIHGIWRKRSVRLAGSFNHREYNENRNEKKNINNDKFIVLFSLLRLDLMRIEHRIWLLLNKQYSLLLPVPQLLRKSIIIITVYFYTKTSLITCVSQVFVVRLFSLAVSHLCVY